MHEATVEVFAIFLDLVFNKSQLFSMIIETLISMLLVCLNEILQACLLRLDEVFNVHLVRLNLEAKLLKLLHTCVKLLFRRVYVQFACFCQRI